MFVLFLKQPFLIPEKLPSSTVSYTIFYTKYLSYERAMKLNLEKINKVQRKKKKSGHTTFKINFKNGSIRELFFVKSFDLVIC